MEVLWSSIELYGEFLWSSIETLWSSICQFFMEKFLWNSSVLLFVFNIKKRTVKFLFSNEIRVYNSSQKKFGMDIFLYLLTFYLELTLHLHNNVSQI
jgi:hypothetical protein